MIDFNLPKELIAQEPASPRDAARLLVYDRKTKTTTDAIFRDLEKYLYPKTTLVLNNSKVEHCRWLFTNPKPASLPTSKAGSNASFSSTSALSLGESRSAVPKVQLACDSQVHNEIESSLESVKQKTTEVFVIEKLDTHTIRGLVRPGKRFKEGSTTQLTEWLSVEVLSIDADGIRTLKLNISHDDERLKQIEHVPLPPYIKQNDTLADDYQTIYAKPLGSKAAPTAGLHFTDQLLANIKTHFAVEELTLHVGLGTFASLTDENYTSGTLHEEWYEIAEKTAAQLNESKHITAVGTTTSRALESWAQSGKLTGETNIFIRPGYEFQKVDSLITNFHLPGTSLLLMIEAFIGSDAETKRIYDHAISEKYRFYSFGDAMLIL